jgi:hypothetical protein
VSLRSDRVLSQAMRYGRHRLAASGAVEKLASAMAFDAFAQQFDRPTRDRMTAVYLGTLAGTLVEDRRTRGRQLW